MAHYYQNKLIITGDSFELEKFKEYARRINGHGDEEKLSLEKIMPSPEKLKILAVEGKSLDSYKLTEWRCENWGPKNILETELHEALEDSRMCYEFRSSNGELSEKVLKTISTQWPGLQFTYFYDCWEDAREGVKIIKDGALQQIENCKGHYTGAIFEAGADIRQTAQEHSQDRGGDSMTH